MIPTSTMATAQLVPTVTTCLVPRIDSVERHGYLFGLPIAHSLSPRIHQTTYDALGLPWAQFLLPSTDMAQFLGLVRDPRCYGTCDGTTIVLSSRIKLTARPGAAVTMPHKVTIMQHLDDITPECRAVGACNTIFRRGSQLV